MLTEDYKYWTKTTKSLNVGTINFRGRKAKFSVRTTEKILEIWGNQGAEVRECQNIQLLHACTSSHPNLAGFQSPLYQVSIAFSHAQGLIRVVPSSCS